MPKKGQQTIKTIKPTGVVTTRRLTAPQAKRVIDARQKQEKALNLRKAGATLQQIADACGYASPSGAKQAIDSAIDRLALEPAKDVVRLELQRLDQMQQIAWTKMVSEQDPSYIPNILAIMRERARYIGLDSFVANQSVNIGINVGADGKVQVGTKGGVLVIQGTSEEQYVKQLALSMGMDESEIAKHIPDPSEDPQVIVESLQEDVIDLDSEGNVVQAVSDSEVSE